MHEPAKSVSQICRGKRWGVIASYSDNNAELVMTVEIVGTVLNLFLHQNGPSYTGIVISSLEKFVPILRPLQKLELLDIRGTCATSRYVVSSSS